MEQRTEATEDLRIDRWSGDGPPREQELYARMEAEGYAPYLRGEPPGTRKPLHQHPFPEVFWVVSGWVRYRFPQEDRAAASEVILKAGDRIALPAGLPHETAVEGAAYLVYLTNSPYSLPVMQRPPRVNT